MYAAPCYGMQMLNANLYAARHRLADAEEHRHDQEGVKLSDARGNSHVRATPACTTARATPAATKGPHRQHRIHMWSRAPAGKGGVPFLRSKGLPRRSR